jgi:hypothetical protein
VIEKARRVMGERLGNIRTWQELPVSRVSISLRLHPCINPPTIPIPLTQRLTSPLAVLNSHRTRTDPHRWKSHFQRRGATTRSLSVPSPNVKRQKAKCGPVAMSWQTRALANSSRVRDVMQSARTAPSRRRCRRRRDCFSDGQGCAGGEEECCHWGLEEDGRGRRRR